MAGSILVVEDNTVNQKVAVAMIESLGYGAEAVGNGLEAVEACSRQTYDAILMDCQMPQMDGFKATAFIRQREGVSRRTPIIALTASVTAEDRQRCLAAGMDDYLSKPVPREALASALRKWIATPGTPPPVETAATPSALPSSHPLRVLESHAGPRAMAEVIDVFLQTIPRRLDDLRQAHARADVDDDPRPRPQPQGRVRADRRARHGRPLRPDRSRRARRRRLRARRPPHRAGSGLRGRQRVAARGAAARLGAGRELISRREAAPHR